MLSNFEGFEHQETKSSPSRRRELRGTIPVKSTLRRQLAREVPPVHEAPRKVQNTGTRASGKKTLCTGVGAVREGAPYEREF